MRLMMIITLLLTTSIVMAQTTVNQNLKKQLDSIYTLDQKYRDMLTYLSRPTVDESFAKKIYVPVPRAVAMLQREQYRLDSTNFLVIENIIKHYGYPGKKLVGTPANEIAWNVIEHAGKITAYLPVIKQAADDAEIPYYLYATMLDKCLAAEGKEQVYGSQCTCEFLKTGVRECFVWPVKEPAGINERRKKAGFVLTVEENAARLGVQYRVIKLDDIATKQ